MATKKRKRKSPPPRPKRMRATLVRLSDREEAAIKAVAGREPIATFVRRVLLDALEKGMR